MFEELLEIGMPIDVMIEYTHTDSIEEAEHSDVPIPDDETQINHVRKRLNKCIVGDCSLKVHWTDPTYSPDIPDWMNELYKCPIDSARWIHDPLISENIHSEDDIPKLLLENPLVMEEIAHSSIPQRKWIRLYLDVCHHTSLRVGDGKSWRELVPIYFRHVMDIYTVAKILKTDMKNVIVYSGISHYLSIIYILEQVGFSTIKEIDGKCAS
jgi:hypothetical protein